jgi:hypothetical protein
MLTAGLHKAAVGQLPKLDLKTQQQQQQQQNQQMRFSNRSA